MRHSTEKESMGISHTCTITMYISEKQKWNLENYSSINEKDLETSILVNSRDKILKYDNIYYILQLFIVNNETVL